MSDHTSVIFDSIARINKIANEISYLGDAFAATGNTGAAETLELFAFQLQKNTKAIRTHLSEESGERLAEARKSVADTLSLVLGHTLQDKS